MDSRKNCLVTVSLKGKIALNFRKMFLIFLEIGDPMASKC